MAWYLILAGTIGVFNLQRLFGGTIIVTAINALQDEIQIPRITVQWEYFFMSIWTVWHTRKYLEEGEMSSVRTGFRATRNKWGSTIGILGYNWLIAFLPDYQLYQLDGWWSDIVG